MIGSMPVTDVYTQYYMGGARWITKMYRRQLRIFNFRFPKFLIFLVSFSVRAVLYIFFFNFRYPPQTTSTGITDYS